MNRFLQGTLILFISGIILKIMGFCYQIYIVRAIGTEAVGLVNMVHPYYISLVILATMGMPIAISRLVAAKAAQQKNTTKIMRTAFLLVSLLSIGLIILAVIFMPVIFDYLNFDHRLRWCFYTLLPGVAIVPLSSVMRGYFQGRCQMLSPAISQIFEQICRITIGIGLIYYFRAAYQGYLAIFLCAAVISGEFCGMVVLSILYFHTRLKETGQNEKAPIAQEMLSLGIPATLSRLTSSADLMLEAWILPRGLRMYGATSSESAALYGQLNSVCFGLISLPGVLTNALATMLLPSIAALSVTNNTKLKQKCSDSLLVTAMLAVPVAVIFYQEGGAILELIYHLKGLDIIMQALSLGAVFIYLGQTTVGILQGLGKNKAVFLTNFIGSLTKIILLWLLVWKINGSILGAAWAFTAAYFLQCILNLCLLKYYVHFKLAWVKIITILLLSLGLGGILVPLTAYLQCFFCAYFVIIASILLGIGYLLLLRILKIFSWQLLS